MAMYLKIKQGSQLYDKLSEVIKLDTERNDDYCKWQIENLPKFNRKVLRYTPFFLFRQAIAWEFMVEVDMKVWQDLKGYAGFYEPNKKTKAGKEMRARIKLAEGNPFNRLDFYDLFGLSVTPDRLTFTIPRGFMYNEDVYMLFDDRFYIDIITEYDRQFELITRQEWDEAVQVYSLNL